MGISQGSDVAPSSSYFISFPHLLSWLQLLLRSHKSTCPFLISLSHISSYVSACQLQLSIAKLNSLSLFSTPPLCHYCHHRHSPYLSGSELGERVFSDALPILAPLKQAIFTDCSFYLQNISKIQPFFSILTAKLLSMTI